MKKILFVIPSLAAGGAERALSNITMHFPNDWQIDILVNDTAGAAYSFKGNILTLGITGKAKTSSVLFQAKVFFKRVRCLKRLKRNGNYQACVSFLDSANIANILSGKKYGRNIVSVRISLKQSAILPQYKYVVNPLVRIFYRLADQIVAVSEGVREELIMDFGLKKEKIVTIENGYSLAEIHQQGMKKFPKYQEELFANKSIITTMGRLSLQKGQWHLIRALTEVVKQVPDTMLIVIGSGELEGYLKQLVRQCEMESNVYFTGHSDNPFQYLNYSDIFVLPSMYEGFPNALAEAVCMGLPCIATDFRTGARELLAPAMDVQGNGISNIVEAEYGILTPLCSGRQYADLSKPLEREERYLAEAVVMLLTDENKRNGYKQKSLQRRETLDINAVVNKWVKVIENN